jgi:indole-3-glycerol phosphate synthase
MSTILDKILNAKRHEVSAKQTSMPWRALELSPYFGRTCLSLSAQLFRDDQSGIIAEFKRKSPSKGAINANADAATIAKAYVEAGAAGVSVLTDGPFFGGSNDDLLQVRKAIQQPVLRKEFIIDEYQILEAKSIGADLILLIAAALSPAEVKSLSDVAHSLGMEVLLELHDESEFRHITPDIALIGVNNRNLNTFETSLQTSYDLAEKLPHEKIWVSESGLHHTADLRELKSAGYRGFLVGEAFMKTDDPGSACAQFVQAIDVPTSLYLS